MLKISSLQIRTTVRDKAGEVLSPISLVFVGIMIIALLLGITSGITNFYIPVIIIAACIMAITLLLRLDELAVVFILIIRLYVDWYLGMQVIALLLACFLLVIFLLPRSPQLHWEKPRCVWLWGLFIVLSILPAMHGLTLLDAFNYYINIVAGSFILFWLGTVVAKSMISLKNILYWLAGFGTLIAIHSIIQAISGQALFASPRFDDYFASISNYEIETSFHRAGSFLINPDSSGVFFAMMLPLTMGLFVQSSTLLGKFFYTIEAALIVVALLLSYSTGAWAAASIGIFVFLILIKKIRYYLQIIPLCIIMGAVLILAFPQQLEVQLRHASEPNELSLRTGAWQTGVNVIRAFPLTGIGLGRYVYLRRAELYRVPAQYRPLYHPHNSYLEIAALAGIPVFAVFIALLVFLLRLAVRNHTYSDVQHFMLISGGISSIVALSFNSLVVSGWTLPPLAAIGWIILGVISSPLLAKDASKGKNNG